MHGISGGSAIEGSSTSFESFYQLFRHSVAVDVPNLLGRFKRINSVRAVELRDDGVWQ